MTDQEVFDHLQAGLAAAREAGAIALDYFRKPITVEDKMPGAYYDPVTEADKGIETRLRELLSAQFPEHRIIGEEHGDTGGSDTYWIIDPIDGTRAFISGLPTWGVLLGFVVDGRPVGGLMHQPYTGETWIADPLRGARFIHNSSETALCTRSDATLADSILCSTHPSTFFDSELFARYQTLMSRVRMQRWGGDCYGFALVAQGCIDLMVDTMLMPYDIVALIPIIELAGGIVTDFDGKSPMQGGNVIAAANAEIHAAALAVLRQ